MQKSKAVQITCIYDFILHSRASTSPAELHSSGGSAKLARKGVTLAQPLWKAQASDPTGRDDSKGLTMLCILGENLNTNSPISLGDTFVHVSAREKSTSGESGPPDGTTRSKG
jgi:hypothetical protein